MTKKIIILGTGGNCLDILDTLNDINEARRQREYECVGFLDDDPQTWNQQLNGVLVLGALDTARQYPDCYLVNGIGSVRNFWAKREIIARTCAPRERFETIIHPTASISRTARLGCGVVVFPHVTIASHAVIDDHVIILPSSVISHDDRIGDYTCITSGVCISGGVVIGQACYLGTNASINSNIQIEDHCLVGMGSVVLSNVAANSVVVGNPARFLRQTLAKG